MPKADASQTASYKYSPIDFLLFALMAAYGTAFSFIGNIRFVELIVVLIAIPFAALAYKGLNPKLRILFFLFLFTAFIHILSDIYNNSNAEDAAKRAITYLFLAVLMVALNFLANNRLGRLRIIVLGYCLSYVVILFLGTSVSENYNTLPWRLGLGMAVTIAICVALSFGSLVSKFAPLALLTLAGVHIVMQSRSLALITALAAVLVFLSVFVKGKGKRGSDNKNTLIAALTTAFLVIAGYAGAKTATTLQLFPFNLQQKMELQLAHPDGLLAASRPEAMAAVYAISKRPISGYGSSGSDYDVIRYYSFLKASSYFGQESFDILVEQSLNSRKLSGLPSHSHLLGAWTDAGFFATFGWFFVLWICFQTITIVFFRPSPWSSLAFLLSLATIWDVFFSPGPERFDMAIRLIVITLILHRIRELSANQNEKRIRRQERPGRASVSGSSLAKDSRKFYS